MTLAPSQVGAISVLRVTGPAEPGKWVGTDGLGNAAWLDPPPVVEATAEAVAAAVPDPAVEQALSLRYSRVTTPEMYGAVGDGTTSDAIALRDALAAGGTVQLARGKTYGITPIAPLSIPAGTRIIGGGATLHFTTLPSDGSFLHVLSDVTIDELSVSFPGGQNVRGVSLRGSNIHVGALNVEARSRAGWGNVLRQRGLAIGVPEQRLTDISIDRVSVTHWDQAIAVENCEDVTIGRAKVRHFRTGINIVNSRRVTVSGGSTNDVYAERLGQAGENSILIGSDTPGTTGDIVVRDFRSYGSGEHGFRVGGSVPIKGVTFDNCFATQAGLGTDVNHGGCGFKVLGPTVMASNAAKHSDITFLNCVVEDLSENPDPPFNFAGFNIGKCRNVKLINPTVRAAGSTYSAWNGIEMIGSDHVTIVSPTLEGCAGAGIRLYDYVSTPHAWGGDPGYITITGGLIDKCQVGIDIDIAGRTLRRMSVQNLIIEGGVHAVRAQNAIANRCVMRLHLASQTGASLTGGSVGQVHFHIDGDLDGDLATTSVARGGSTWTRYGGGFYVLKAGGWTAI